MNCNVAVKPTRSIKYRYEDSLCMSSLLSLSGKHAIVCLSKDSNLRHPGHALSTLSTEPRYLMVKSDILEFTKIYVGT